MKVTTTSLIECGPHRTSSRSVSWNSSGTTLAMASSDRMARLWNVENQQVREVLVVSGHTAPVLKVRFHPQEVSQLCTVAADATVRLWDVRGASQRPIGKIDIGSGQAACAVEWCRHSSYATMIAVTERDGSINVYDIRKLGSGSTTSNTASGKGRNSRTTPMSSLGSEGPLHEACLFSPDGNYLITASTDRIEGYGALQVWDWKLETSQNPIISYPGHCGPISCMDISPDGKRLASGGSDAAVGLWDTDTMCCTHVIPRRLKFILSVAFSQANNSLVAIANEEDKIEIADSQTGNQVGTVDLSNNRPRAGGAEEVAWHPTQLVLACARTEPLSGLHNAPVAIAFLSLSESE